MLEVVKGIDDACAMREWLHHQPSVAIDTETTGLEVFSPDFRVRLTQFGTTTESWVFPTEGWEGFIDELIRNYKGRILMHNARYDIHALAAVGIKVPWGQVDDTMIALRLAEPHRSAALKTACARHVSAAAAGQQDLQKAMKTQGWTWATVPLDFERYVFYAAMDTVLTARLAETRVCKAGFASPVYQLEMDVRELCSQMEKDGMRVDMDFSRATNENLTAEIEHRTKMIQDTFDVNVSSPARLARWLLSNGAKIQKRTGGGAPSTDRESLEMILGAHPEDGAIRTVTENALRVRDLTKLSSSYFSNFLGMQEGGLLHAQINTLAAKTGRMSCSHPALQTLPRGDNPDAKLVRTAIIPRNEGELLVSCDYEQIELRLIAAESGDEGLMEAFRLSDTGDTDFFTAAMRTVYGDDEMPKSDPKRSLIKVLFYASAYGAGIPKMAAQAGVPEYEMRDTATKVFKKYPGVKKLMRECEVEATNNDSWISTPMGRKLWVDPDAPYKALNAKIQGFAGDLFKRAMVNLGQAGLADYMCVPVHDEILFSIPADLIEDLRPVIEESMSTEWKGVQLAAAPSPGAVNWGKVEK